MTILVSNANGKVGQQLVQALLDAGAAVRIGARDLAKAKARFPGATAVALDVTRPETLAAAVAGAKAVFSAVPYELQPEGERNLIAAAASAGVERFVKLSAMGVDADPASPHMVAEAALAASGLAWTVIRPTFFMQNYATMMGGAVRAGTFYEPAAGGATCFVDTRDIAAVAVLALTEPGHAGKIYSLTGPAALTRDEVAATLSTVIGRPVLYVAVDDAALRRSMAGAAPSLVELMSKLYAAVRAGYTATGTDTIAALTGRPAISFERFARDSVGAWR